jgi:hypothetical protein
VFIESHDSGFAITPDATYDPVIAFFDEKAFDPRFFLEEYGNDIKDANDPNHQVNIYALEMTHGCFSCGPPLRI